MSMPRVRNSVPCFDVSNISKQPEAQVNFSELGITIPMVAVHFDDIDSIANPGHENLDTLTQKQTIAFWILVNTAFQYLGGVSVVPLVFSSERKDSRSGGFHPTNRPPTIRARLPQNNLLHATRGDGPWHNDLYNEHPQAIIYGAHLTLEGSGIVEAAVAPISSRTRGNHGRKFSRAAFATHRRDFQKGDLHIFIRQPSRRRLLQPDLHPTTHQFTSHRGGRMYVEESFGLSCEWQHQTKPRLVTALVNKLRRSAA